MAEPSVAASLRAKRGITEDSSLIHKVWILDEPVIAGRESIRTMVNVGHPQLRIWR